ncbi:DNA polymerase III subunit epsilon [Rickettsiales bacterium (ex Bugula neritina AB1)]|nr:DNA polymerase III subunit epsilon [Rickettsiales bacterium (ex Bugula neritina AB1)]
MREIVLDTETTGLNKEKNRIIEIGAVELFDRMPTGNFIHYRINPQMIIPEDSTKVCGITNEMVKNSPIFGEIVDELLSFIKNDPIIAHNIKFDAGFVNMELERLNLPILQNPLVDTLEIARKVFPGMPCNLDALCKRFKISLHKRSKHGALLDAQLLVEVYINLLEKTNKECLLVEEDFQLSSNEIFNWNRNLIIFPSSEELQEHEVIIEKLNNNN